MSSGVSLATGAVFEGYRVLGMLATGHMGSIYSVEDAESGKQRAVKLLHPAVVLPGFDPATFDRHLLSGKDLDREHYVEVIKTGYIAERQTPWFAMQLLRGENANARVRAKGPLSPPHLLELFNQSAAALQKAHDRRLAHGDLKPENIFLASARRVGMPFSVNLLDYGVARFVDTQEKLWKAPEQTPGRCDDPRIDVWALGLVAFYLLTGRSFWDAPDATDPSHGHPVVPPAGHAAMTLGAQLPYPQAFDTFFARCVAPDPADRFEDAASLMKGLRRVLSGMPLDAAPRRAGSILGSTSHAATVPQVDRALPGRISHSELLGQAHAQAQAASQAPTQGTPYAPPNPYAGAPSHPLPPTQLSPGTPPRAPANPFAATQAATPSLHHYAQQPQAAATVPGTEAWSGAPTQHAPPPTAPVSTQPHTPAASPHASGVSAASSGAHAGYASGVPAASSGAHAGYASGVPAASSGAHPTSAAVASAPAASQPKKGSSALAIGGCAVGVVGLVAGGFALLVVIVIVIVAVASGDDSGASAGTRPIQVGDRVEIKDRVAMDFTVAGHKRVLKLNNDRRVEVLALSGAEPSRVKVAYLVKREEFDGKAKDESVQGKTYIVDTSRGTPDVTTESGSTPPTEEVKQVQDDAIGLGASNQLPSGLKVGQTTQLPAGLLGTEGLNFGDSTLTFRGQERQGGSEIARYDVTVDASSNSGDIAFSTKLTGSLTADASTSRLLSVEMRGPLTMRSSSQTATGFLEFSESRSYQDRP